MIANQSEQRDRLSRLQGFLKSDPDNRSLLQEAAEVAMKCGALDEARTILERALVAHPADASFRFQLGTLALAGRRWADAETIFDALRQEGSAHPAIGYNLAYAQIMAGRHAEARAVLDTFGDADWAAVPDARKLYAHACHHLEDAASGIAHLRIFLGQQKDDAEAWGLLAMLQYDADQYDGLEAAAEQALNLKPDEPNALLALGSLWLERQEPDKTLEFLERLVQKYPEHGRAWSGIAFARMLRMELPVAVEAFEKATRFMPNHIGTWHGLAWLQILKNDLAAAEESLNKAMAIDRNFGETHGGLAVLAVLQGKHEIAEPMIRRATGLDKNSFAGRFARSLLLAQKGQKTEANELVRNILAGSPTGQGPGLQEAMMRVLARHVQAGAERKPQGPRQ